MWQYSDVVTFEETCNTQSHRLNVRIQPGEFHDEIRWLEIPHIYCVSPSTRKLDPCMSVRRRRTIKNACTVYLHNAWGEID